MLLPLLSKLRSYLRKFFHLNDSSTLGTVTLTTSEINNAIKRRAEDEITSGTVPVNPVGKLVLIVIGASFAGIYTLKDSIFEDHDKLFLAFIESWFISAILSLFAAMTCIARVNPQKDLIRQYKDRNLLHNTFILFAIGFWVLPTILFLANQNYF